NLRPQFRADASGLLVGSAGGARFVRKFVPWSAVATCEIRTTYPPWGEPTLIVPTLKGARGQTLLTLNLKALAKPDQKRLIKYIKAKLPKTALDPWDDPL